MPLDRTPPARLMQETRAKPRSARSPLLALAAVLALGSPAIAQAQLPRHAEMAAHISDGLAAAADPSADWRGAAAGTGGVVCQGDCDSSGVVSVNEIIRGVLIAADALDIASCPAFDVNDDGTVSVNELIGAILRALEGCGGTGAVSVCGGPITSAPKLCNLRIEPARVQVGANVTISFGLSDLEGDIVTLCIGLGRVGGTGMERCDPVEPFGETVNLVAEVPGITVNLEPGEYEMAVLVIDADEARSEVIVARFTVFRLRR